MEQILINPRGLIARKLIINQRGLAAAAKFDSFDQCDFYAGHGPANFSKKIFVATIMPAIGGRMCAEIDFSGSVFYHCIFDDIGFFRCNFKDCKFFDCHFCGCIFDNKTDFSEAVFFDVYGNSLELYEALTEGEYHGK